MYVPMLLQLRLELLDAFGAARRLTLPPDHPQLWIKIHANTDGLAAAAAQEYGISGAHIDLTK